MSEATLAQELEERFGAGSFRPLSGRGNSSVGVWQSDRVYFVKHYPADANWDRRLTEARVIEFYAANGIVRIPKLLHSDETQNYSVFSYIDGTPEYTVDEKAFDQIRIFLGQIMHLPANLYMPGEAKEAFFHTKTLRGHIDGRYAFLRKVDDTQLQDYLNTDFANALEKVNYATLVDIDCGDRTIISPSDFGTHNSLHTPNGELYFIDFEYGGRDSKYKLLADIYWHPGSNLTDQQRQELIEPLLADAGEHAIFRQARQMMGLKWALLVLNEFIPGQIEKRLKATLTKDSADEIKKRQLAKSLGILDKVLNA